MKAWLGYCVDVFIRPRAAMRRLLADPRRVTYGFLSLLALTIIYVLAISVLVWKGLPPAEKPLLDIPPEKYYLYELFFLLPVAIGETVLQAGVTRLIARPWGGRGCFEDLFALFGLNHIVLAIVMGLPDLAIYIFAPGIRGGFDPHVLVGTLWCFILTIVSVKEAERLPWGRSIVVAVVGSLASGILAFTYIR